MIRSSRLLAVCCAALLLAAGCSSRGDLPEVDVSEAAASADPLTEPGELVDAGWPRVAATVAAAAEEGRPSVVNLFAAWCGPCEEELPLLLDAAERRPEVMFIGVDSEDFREDGEQLVADNGVDWPVAFDRPADVHVTLRGQVMPTTAFFDDEGQLVDVVEGQLDAAQLEEELDAIASP